MELRRDCVIIDIILHRFAQAEYTFFLSQFLSKLYLILVVCSGLTSNYDAVMLADDIDKISHLLENLPVEFGQAIKWI